MASIIIADFRGVNYNIKSLNIIVIMLIVQAPGSVCSLVFQFESLRHLHQTIEKSCCPEYIEFITEDIFVKHINIIIS